MLFLITTQGPLSFVMINRMQINNYNYNYIGYLVVAVLLHSTPLRHSGKYVYHFLPHCRNLYILPTQFICLFSIILPAVSKYFAKQFYRFLLVMELYFAVRWNLSKLCVSSMSFGIHVCVCVCVCVCVIHYSDVDAVTTGLVYSNHMTVTNE
jgi:hypothetical protein